MKMLLYAAMMLVCLFGALLGPVSAIIENWSWARWGVLFFAVAFPLAFIGDMLRETPEQQARRLEAAIKRRDASRRLEE